jgi:hypothetical protein
LEDWRNESAIDRWILESGISMALLSGIAPNWIVRRELLLWTLSCFSGDVTAGSLGDEFAK